MRKPITPQKDVGKELGHISTRNETKLRTKRQQTLATGKPNPQVATLPRRKNQLLYLKTRIQKIKLRYDSKSIR